MSTPINIKFSSKEEYNNNEEEEKSKNEIKYDEIEIEAEEDDMIYIYDIDINIKDEINYVKNKKKVFAKLSSLYYILDKFFIIINFSTLLFSIFFTESNISLALSIYTLSFSIVFDTKGYITVLDKLIILYEDEIIPEINKSVRKYYRYNEFNGSCHDIISNLQKIEKNYLRKHFGSSFSIPKRLRSIDWIKIFLVCFFYVVSFISLSIMCYFRSIKQI